MVDRRRHSVSVTTGRAARQGYQWRNIFGRNLVSGSLCGEKMFMRNGISFMERYTCVSRCAARIKARSAPPERALVNMLRRRFPISAASANHVWVTQSSPSRLRTSTSGSPVAPCSTAMPLKLIQRNERVSTRICLTSCRHRRSFAPAPPWAARQAASRPVSTSFRLGPARSQATQR